MKRLFTITVAAGLAFASFSSRADLVLDFQSEPGVKIAGAGADFLGAGPPGSPYFVFTGASGSSAKGDSVGDTGVFDFGPISIASVNAAGTAGTLAGGNSFRISDALANPPAVDTAHTLYTVVNWSTISFVSGQVTLVGNIGLNPSFFTTLGVYTGAQGDLQTVVNAANAVITITYQTSAANLNDLNAGDVSAFSGQIFASTSVMPEPATVLEGALLLLPFGLGAWRSFRNNSTSVKMRRR
jgi:hypothetical protein